MSFQSLHFHYFFLTILFSLLYRPATSQLTSNDTSFAFLPQESLEECLTNGFCYDCSICPCFSLGPQQKIWNLIIASPSAIFPIIFIILFAMVEALRKKPGQFVLIATISQFVYSLLVILENTDLPQIDPTTFSDDQAYLPIGFFKILSSIITTYYLFAYFAVNSLTEKTSSQAFYAKEAFIHGIGAVLSVLLMSAIYAFDMIGRGVDGNCGIKTIPGALSPLLTYGLLVVLSFFVLCIGRKQITRMRGPEDVQREACVKHNLLYMTIICNMFLITGALNIVESLSVYSYVSKAANDGQSFLTTVMLLRLVFANFCPLLLIFSRLREPLIKEHVLAYLGECLCCRHVSLSRQVSQSNITEKAFFDSLNTEESIDLKRHLLHSEGSSPIHSPPVYKVLKDCEKEPKLDIMTSMLASLHYFLKTKSKILSDVDYQAPTGLMPRTNKRELRKEMFIQNEVLRRNVPQVIREIKRRNQRFMPGNFKTYSIQSFQDIIEQDKASEEINEAFNFTENYGSLFNNGYYLDENGRVLFFSSNKKFVLKEISHGERRELLKLLPRISKHFRLNPCSLLARVYGIFTFDGLRGLGFNQEVTMVLMRNISQCKTSELEKQYKLDHKTAEEGVFTERVGKILYTKYLRSNLQCEKIPFDKGLKFSLMKTLEKDINFLSSLNLANYNVQIDVVNTGHLNKETLNGSIILEADEWEEASQPSISFLSEDQNQEQSMSSSLFNSFTPERNTSIFGNQAFSMIQIGDYWRTSPVNKSEMSFLERILDFKNCFNNNSDKAVVAQYGQKLLESVENFI